MSSSAVIELVQTSRASRTAGGTGGVDKQTGGDKNRIAGSNAGTKEGDGEDWAMVDQSIKQLVSADGAPFYRDHSASAVPAVPDCDWPTDS